MSLEQPGQMITEVPGMEPYAGQMPSREVVTIPADKVTAQMHANALGSPNNIHAGAFKPEMAANSAEQSISGPTEAVGSTAVQSLVEVDQASLEAPVADANEFESLWNVEGPEDIEVQPASAQPSRESDVAIRTRQQMAISAADRSNRAQAGLPPRTYDLR